LRFTIDDLRAASNENVQGRGAIMSKAFTRESDDERDEPGARPTSSLPPGAKNYLTPDGAKRLREELEQLQREKRPKAAALADKNESQRQLLLIDRRMRQLEESLRTAEVAPPPERPWEQVRFGATVRVRDKDGEETRYRIVGVDETDLDRDWVSWVSPIARALLNRRAGDQVKIRVPAGERALEILEIGYD
jgi:transcription elongation factor GreB